MNLDPSTGFGRRVLERLQSERIIWLTAVDVDGRPQPNPVWFLWEPESETILIYSRPGAHRFAHMQVNPNVSLHFNSNEQGGDIAVITGRVALDEEVPPSTAVLGYVEKYTEGFKRLGMTPESFAESYSVGYRVKAEHLRGF